MPYQDILILRTPIPDLCHYARVYQYASGLTPNGVPLRVPPDPPTTVAQALSRGWRLISAPLPSSGEYLWYLEIIHP